MAVKPATRKASSRKSATRSVKVVKKTAAKAKPVKKAAAPTTAIKEPFTKTQIQSEIAERTELTKKQVAAVFEELGTIIERHIKKRAAGEFTLPGLLKVKVTRKPATKARKGINPFTGEETIFKAKPARNVVKLKPLKKLKDMVE